MTAAADGGQQAIRRIAGLLTVRRLSAWGFGLFVLSWFIYIHTLATPGLVDRAGRFKGADYIQFYVMGSMVREHRTEELYEPEAHLRAGRERIDANLQFFAPRPNYPPQLALAFAPLAALPYGPSLAVFETLSLLCYAVSVWLLWRECEALRAHRLLVAVLAAASPALFTVLRYGQASAFALLVWTVTFVALRRGRAVLAGIALGCLAWKPQLALIPAVALLVGREWRASIAAAGCVCLQFALGIAVAGWNGLRDYLGALQSLAFHPDTIVMFQSEVHSIRGFVRLAMPWAPWIGVVSAAALIAAVAVAVRLWRTDAPMPLRWGALAIATLLASPHLLTYDLLLLTLPMIVLADWAAAHREHPLWSSAGVLLVLLYFAPFSANFARFSAVQLSVPIMVVALWRMSQLCGVGLAAVSSTGRRSFTPAMQLRESPR